VLGIIISELDELQLPQNLRVDQSEIIVNCLVKNHVVDVKIDLLTYRPNPLNSVDIDQI